MVCDLRKPAPDRVYGQHARFRLAINTFSHRDLSIEAFDPRKNHLSGLVAALLVVFALAYPIARCYDARIKQKDVDGSREVAFWRKMNWAHQQQLEGRSAPRFFKLTKWALRRRHPWGSLYFRPDGDYMISQKRLMLLLALLLNVTGVCALLIGNDQALPFVTGAFANALVACTLSFPVPYLFGKLFARPTPVRFRIQKENAMPREAALGTS